MRIGTSRLNEIRDEAEAATKKAFAKYKKQNPKSSLGKPQLNLMINTVHSTIEFIIDKIKQCSAEK